MRSGSNLEDQLSSSLVDQLNVAREADLAEGLQKINENLSRSIEQQDNSFTFATDQINKVREELTRPENILGSNKTKHGEIAEKIEVGIRNAKEALAQKVDSAKDFSATFEGVGRTAPEDYIIDGIQVQAKFINGANNNLRHVIEHMEKYDYFGRDYSYYHVPKDTHETVLKIINGENVDNLKDSTIRAIKEKANSIEAASGRSFEDVVRAGKVGYSEVQINTAGQTLDVQDEILNQENIAIKDDIHQGASDEKNTVLDENQPSLEELGQAAIIGGAVGAGIALTKNIYSNYKDGKNIFAGDYSSDDWKKLGVDTSKYAAIGGLSGAAIYGITNYAGMAAPFAGAIVTATKGVTALIKQYKNGEITQTQFIDLGFIVCAESAVVGVCTVIGQTLIPIPVLGAVVGSIAGTLLVGVGKSLLSSDRKLIEKKIKLYQSKLDEVSMIVIDKIEEEFKNLGDLTVAAFKLENNQCLLKLSLELAEEHGVNTNKLIKNHNELDDFMTA
ncbi:MAG: hypothetical protein ACJAWL_002971 [Motiliproteus sp.]|jgi:hypothetical protein